MLVEKIRGEQKNNRKEQKRGDVAAYPETKNIVQERGERTRSRETTVRPKILKFSRNLGERSIGKKEKSPPKN